MKESGIFTHSPLLITPQWCDVRCKIDQVLGNRAVDKNPAPRVI